LDFQKNDGKNLYFQIEQAKASYLYQSQKITSRILKETTKTQEYKNNNHSTMDNSSRSFH